MAALTPLAVWPHNGVAAQDIIMPNTEAKGKTKRKSFLPKTWGVFSRVAEELGINPATVSRVANGEKKSARVAEALKARGIKVPEARRAS